jgi:hypothetical protein
MSEASLVFATDPGLQAVRTIKILTINKLFIAYLLAFGETLAHYRIIINIFYFSVLTLL